MRSCQFGIVHARKMVSFKGADSGWVRTPRSVEMPSLGRKEAATDAAEGLLTGNHLPDSYVGGLLECNTDLGQGHTGSLAFRVQY